MGLTLRHESLVIALRREGGLCRPCESEIAYFEITVGIEQEVGWFQVSMDDFGEEGRVSLSRLDLRKRGRGEGKGKKGKTQTYFQQNAKPSKLYMFGIRNIDNGRRSGLGFGSRDEDLFREVLGRGRLFRFHSQKKEKDEKLVMEKEWIRWRRRGKKRDMPSLKVS